MNGETAKRALSFLNKNAPYVVQGRWPLYTINFEDGTVTHYKWTIKDHVKDICHLMNVAYMEGYIQRTREE